MNKFSLKKKKMKEKEKKKLQKYGKYKAEAFILPSPETITVSVICSLSPSGPSYAF